MSETSPPARAPRSRRQVICDIEEIPPGTRKIVEVNRRSIGIFNVNGTLRAVRNVCPHHGAPMCLGELTGTMMPPSTPGSHDLVWGLEGRVLRCPWHGFEFDVETGRAIWDPEDMRVRVYTVSVEDGKVVLEA